MSTREIRMQARMMVKLAQQMGKLEMLRAQNARQLEANPHHPLANAVSKLLSTTKGKLSC